MKAVIPNILIGASGIGASEIVSQATQTDLSDVSQITSILVQIIIGIVTLFGLFKRKKPKNNN